MENDRTLGIKDWIIFIYWLVVTLGGSLVLVSWIFAGAPFFDYSPIPMLLGWLVFFSIVAIYNKWWARRENRYIKKHGYNIGKWHALGDEDIENMDENGNVLTDKAIKKKKK